MLPTTEGDAKEAHLQSLNAMHHRALGLGLRGLGFRVSDSEFMGLGG